MYCSGKSHRDRGWNTHVEKLAGRLKWGRTANGIRVEITGWLGARTLFVCVWMIFWTYLGWGVFKSISLTGDDFLLIWLVFWVLGEASAAVSIAWGFFGKVVLIVDPVLFVLSREIGGLEFRRKEFRTAEVHNMKFLPQRFWPARRLSRLCFTSDGRTIKFASGISYEEAESLIEKMREFRPRAQQLAPEYPSFSR